MFSESLLDDFKACIAFRGISELFFETVENFQKGFKAFGTFEEVSNSSRVYQRV